MPSLARLLALALLFGTVLVSVGGVVHPMLAGDAAAQLRTIAATSYWRPLHLAMLAGSGLVIAGIWVRLAGGRGPAATGVPGPLLAALALIALGLAVNALNIAFMAGSGWHMAAMFARGEGAMEPLFDATHPIGLMAARFGNFIVALGALTLGWVEWHDPHGSRLLAALAWVAAAGGLVGVLFFGEDSRLILGAAALLSGWQVVTAVRALRTAASDP